MHRCGVSMAAMSRVFIFRNIFSVILAARFVHLHLYLWTHSLHLLIFICTVFYSAHFILINCPAKLLHLRKALSTDSMSESQKRKNAFASKTSKFIVITDGAWGWFAFVVFVSNPIVWAVRAQGDKIFFESHKLNWKQSLMGLKWRFYVIFERKCMQTD